LPGARGAADRNLRGPWSGGRWPWTAAGSPCEPLSGPSGALALCPRAPSVSCSVIVCAGSGGRGHIVRCMHLVAARGATNIENIEILNIARKNNAATNINTAN